MECVFLIIYFFTCFLCKNQFVNPQREKWQIPWLDPSWWNKTKTETLQVSPQRRFKSLSLWPQAVRIRNRESGISSCRLTVQKADRATYGVKWTIFFCLFVLFCQAGEEKQKKEIRCGSVGHHRSERKPTPPWRRKRKTTTNTDTHEHTAQKEVLISNFSLLLFHCNNTVGMSQCCS